MAIRVNGDGSKTVVEDSQEAIEQIAQARAHEMVGEIQLSRAQRRLRARREASERPQVIKQNDGVDDWFIRSLSLPLLHRLALEMPRDKDRNLCLDDEQKYAQFVAAILFVCVVESETDLTPYFERTDEGWADALEQANDDSMRTANGLIVNSALLLTNEILPEAAANLNKIIDAKEADAAPLVRTRASSKLPTTKRGSGSTPTRRMKPQSTSQTVSLPPMEVPPPTSLGTFS